MANHTDTPTENADATDDSCSLAEPNQNNTSIDDPNDANRREYFRLNEEIGFSYDVLTPAAAAGAATASQACSENVSETTSKTDRFKLAKTAFDTLNQEAQYSFRKVEQDLPELAQCLKMLNNKIELATRLALTSENLNRCQVNLSPTGLSFLNETALPDGAELLLHLIFYPDFECLDLAATVSHCKPCSESDLAGIGSSDLVTESNAEDNEERDLLTKPLFQIVVQFENLTMLDEQRLTRQLFQAQSRQRRGT